MKRTPISPNLEIYPREFHSLLKNAPLFDSSCSPEARVIYIDRDSGYFLKRAPKGSLANQACMTDYFHKKGLGAEVL